MIIPIKIKNFLKKFNFMMRLNALQKSSFQYFESLTYHFFYKILAGNRYKNLLIKENLKDYLQNQILKTKKDYQIKRKGELNIFFAYRHSNWEKVLPISLKPFGKVFEFEWGSFGFNENDQDWLEKKQKMNKLMMEKYDEALSKANIDVVVGYMSGYTLDPNTLDYFSSKGSIIINFCLDDKVNFPGKKYNGIYSSPAALANKVHLNLTSSPSSVIKYFVHGGPSMFWPEAAHPEIHKPFDTDYKYDVSFVGACYGWRPDFIKKLTKKGVNVVCFGRGWSKGSLSTEDMIKLYSQSRINLGFSGIGYSRKLMCLKGRDFEVTMSGGLYLCQHNPELLYVYDIIIKFM